MKLMRQVFYFREQSAALLGYTEDNFSGMFGHASKQFRCFVFRAIYARNVTPIDNNFSPIVTSNENKERGINMMEKSRYPDAGDNCF